MSGPEGFFTLAAPGKGEAVIRRSRFIGQAAPAGSEEEALAYISSVREAHKGASHHCFAYILGMNAGTMRHSDDGEPQGTAGIPILDVLRKNSLVNCAAVVTRYFGGVLLGTGGLVRAYSQAAAMAVRAAGVAESLRSVRLQARISYACWDRVDHALRRLPVSGIEKEFTGDVGLMLILRESDRDTLEKELAALTDGSAVTAYSQPFYHLWEIELPEQGVASPI